MADIAGLVGRLGDSRPPAERAVAAAQLTELLQAARNSKPRHRALAEQVVVADGPLALLQMAQAVKRNAHTLAPLPASVAPANTAATLALADSALLCLAQLCEAAASALLASGWKVIDDAEGGRPSYLHRPTSVLRNSPPDISWPEAVPGVPLTWAQQLLLDLPVLSEPIATNPAGGGGGGGGGPARSADRRQRLLLAKRPVAGGSGGGGGVGAGPRGVVRVNRHRPGSFSIIDVVADGGGGEVYRQLIRHDSSGSWRHTESLAAMEIALAADGVPDAGLNLLS